MARRALLITAAAALLLASTLALASEMKQRWGGLPESIDLDRSMSLSTEPGVPFDEKHSPWVEQVGLHPKVYIFHNFLTDAERAHIVRLSAPLMRRSSVVGPNGDSVVDEIRTSYGMFIRRLHDPIIERIERRISLFTHFPISHQEDIQVLRYTAGQKYGAHYDSGSNLAEPGPHYRMATFLMYLSDVEEGGETAFPEKSVWYDPEIPQKMDEAGVKLSECAKGHVAYRPKAGDAALFYSFHPNGTMDEASMHTGCPVIKGIKWACPVWIHTDEFEPMDYLLSERRRNSRVEYPQEPGVCRDMHKQCATWAQSGECTKNKHFMIGDGEATGMCMKSCGVCQSCGPTDIECINKNRRRAGYLPLDKDEMEWLGVNWWFNAEPSPEL